MKRALFLLIDDNGLTFAWILEVECTDFTPYAYVYVHTKLAVHHYLDAHPEDRPGSDEYGPQTIVGWRDMDDDLLKKVADATPEIESIKLYKAPRWHCKDDPLWTYKEKNVEKPFETTTFERHGIAFQLEKYIDCDPDLSRIGEYKARLAPGDEWYVDRQDGTLHGDVLPEPLEEDFAGADGKIDYRAYDEAFDKWNEEPYEILVYYLPRMGRNELRYFVPERGKDRDFAVSDEHWTEYVVPGLYSFSVGGTGDIPKEERSKWAAALYCAQDYTHMNDVALGHRWFEGWVVKACLHGEEVASSSLWGIEDNGDEEYEKETIDALVAECMGQLKDTLQHYEGIAEELKKVTKGD